LIVYFMQGKDYTIKVLNIVLDIIMD